MKKLKNVGVLLIVFLVAVGFNNTAVQAYVSGGWTPDARVPGYFDDTFTPFLVADQNRTVHAFASQWINNGSRRLAIVYRQWSLSGGWTRPVDIIIATMSDAQILGAFLDSTDRMHIIFRMGEDRNTAVYYSFAPASNADLATAWSLPEMVGEKIALDSAAITGDVQGNLVIIYSGNMDGSGVYSVTSANAGESWSKPSPVFLTNDTTLIPFSLRLAMGPDGQVRAAWNVVTSLGEDEMLYFVNYNISDSNWSIPVELDSRISLPNYFGPSFPILVDTGTNIIVLYNSGNPYTGRYVDPGRPVMRVSSSSDGGLTWNGPFVPFPLLNGRSGEHALAVDSDGAAHGLFIMRIDQPGDGENKSIGGIWHSAFQNGIWTNPDRIATTYAPHDVRAVISQGNILLAVWREDPGAKKQHGIWFSYTILDSPELPVVIPPTPSSDSAVPVSTLVPTLFSINATETLMVSMNNAPSGIASSPAGPLIISIVPVFLILVGVIVMSLFYHDRNK